MAAKLEAALREKFVPQEINRLKPRRMPDKGDVIGTSPT